MLWVTLFEHVYVTDVEMLYNERENKRVGGEESEPAHDSSIPFRISEA